LNGRAHAGWRASADPSLICVPFHGGVPTLSDRASVILVDTSVWIDHFRSTNQQLAQLLRKSSVLAHSFVIGELALGTLRDPEAVLGSLRGLPQAMKAEDAEVLQLIHMRKLAGLGIGYVDAHLLASTLLTQGASLWTHDKQLAAVASRLALAAAFP
jgi:predicted nucleic acid-binding protein